MRPVFALVADRVEQRNDSAKLSAIGIFDQLAVHTFPYVAESLGVLARFEIDAEESGREVDANIGVVDAAGHRYHLDQRRRLLPPVEAGRPPFWDFALNLVNIPFETPGHFAMVIRIDKVIVAEIPLRVVALPEDA